MSWHNDEIHTAFTVTLEKHTSAAECSAVHITGRRFNTPRRGGGHKHIQNIHSWTSKCRGSFERQEASHGSIQHCSLKACQSLREPEWHHVLSSDFLHLLISQQPADAGRGGRRMRRGPHPPCPSPVRPRSPRPWGANPSGPSRLLGETSTFIHSYTYSYFRVFPAHASPP